MATEQEKFVNESADKGSFKRSPTKFHDVVSAAPGAKFPPEAGRYRLYVSYACPWAHRCLIVLALKGLQDSVAVTVTDYGLPNLGRSIDGGKYKGWEFNTREKKVNDKKSVFYEPHGFKFLSELYELAHPGYNDEYVANGKRPVYSVPVFFDEKTQTIVSNESSEIIVFLNSEFNSIAQNPDLDLNPDKLKKEQERINAIVYPKINDGVYRCGFAKTQKAYEDAYKSHWEGMDEIEKLLGEKKYLCGDTFTLADVRLFVTLIRYDVVYYSHFKTSRNQIKELPNMLRFLKDIYNKPYVKETINIEFIVKHYYGSQTMINNYGVWPLGPLQPDALKYLEE